MPALNIPAMASQELKAKQMNSKIEALRKFNFFIWVFYDLLMMLFSLNKGEGVLKKTVTPFL